MKKLPSLAVTLLSVLLHASAVQAETDPRWSKVIGPEAVERQRNWILQNEERKKKKKEIEIISHKPEVRPCLLEDIVGGMWKRIYFKESPEGILHKLNKRAVHYYLSMDPELNYAFFRSSKSVDDPNAAIQKMKYVKEGDRAQKINLKEGEEKSDLVFSIGKNPFFTYTCTIVKKPSTIFLEGDMVLHGYTNQGESMLYELYRRWF